MTKRAIIYARVSTKRQADDGLPVESQLEHCRAKAAALGAEVCREFVDGGLSGSTDRRPAFQDALNYCAVMDVDYFITWASSRFARNHLDAGHYKGMLARYGTRLVYSSTEVDIRTDDGWFIDAIGAVIDERYSRQVASDTRRSMMKAARDGCFLGGRVPFGYVAVADGKRKRLAPHPVESVVVRDLFAMAGRGLGAKMIALQLNAAGRTLRGRAWAKNTVSYVLRNEVYAGLTVFNRASKRGLNPPQDWVRVNSHAPLIAPDDFSRVQTMISDRQPVNVGGQPRSHFAFTGLLKCGRCGESLHTCSGTGRGKVYHYYGCRSGLSGKSGGCGLRRVRADLFDAWVMGSILDMVLTPDCMADVIDLAQEHRRLAVADRAERRAALVAELRAAERARGNLYAVLEMHGQHAPNLGDLSPRLRELNDQIRRLETGLLELEAEPAANEAAPEVNPAEAAEVLRALVLGCEDPQKLRAFLGAFVKEVTVTDTEVFVDYLPECLVRLNQANTVHSGGIWLPDLATLRTTRLTIRRGDGLRLVA